MADDEREMVYEDYTIFGRRRYRSVPSGRVVADEDAGPVVAVDTPPLSWYFSFRGMP